jgi:hypothetical protein
METAPAVATCHLFGIPCTAVNVVTNIVSSNVNSSGDATTAHSSGGAHRANNEAEDFVLHRDLAVSGAPLSTMDSAIKLHYRLFSCG